MLDNDVVLHSQILLQVEALDHAFVLQSQVIYSFFLQSLMLRLNSGNRLKDALGFFVKLVIVLGV